MKNWLLLLVALLTFGLIAGAAPPKKRAASAKKPAVSASKKTAKQKYATANSRYKQKRAVARGRGRGRSPQPVAVQRRSYGQPRPTDDRYMEIERALATRGYLQREPSSDWTPDCSEALKRFQKDQNLPPNGKLTSLSLIALGLGPKRDTSSVASSTPNP